MGGVGEPSGEPGPSEGPAKLGAPLPTFCWEQIRLHNRPGDAWLVIESRVYDISRWAQQHPGGSILMGHFGAEDATDASHAFHRDLNFVRKFLQPLLIRQLAPEEPGQDGSQNAQLLKDFRALYQAAKDMKLFNSDPTFFAWLLSQILGMEVLAWLVVYLFGSGWVPSTLVILFMVISQSWFTRHDLGQASVFRKPWWDSLAQQLVMGHLKGFSSHWWSLRHFQRHAKPDVLSKDPDVTVAPIFLLGEISAEYGRKKRRYLPYNLQHLYFFLSECPFVPTMRPAPAPPARPAPPLIILVNFKVDNLVHMSVCMQWRAFLWAASFYSCFFLSCLPFYSFSGVLLLFLAVRVLESHWIVWVTQVSHIPKEMSYENHQDWYSSQLAATCNVESSLFLNWFTGHLNFQIEHHLSPTTPRHNCHRVVPLVQALCAKHGSVYEAKPMLTALGDIIRSLKNYGNIWLEAYLQQ